MTPTVHRRAKKKEHDVAEKRRLWNAYQDLHAGRISRRSFLQRAAALGVATPIVLSVLRLTDVAAQEATPGAGAMDAPPSAGTEDQTRGAGGELKLLQWQAPTTLNMHLAGSFKDQLAACLVTEPLIHFLPDATPIPCLVTEVPLQENGRVAADLMTVTYALQDGIVWSDGEPFTAEDVVFTWKWVIDPANQSSNAALYDAIASVDAVDDLTVKITFKEPQLGWNSYFSSAQSGGILPEHILAAGGDANTNFAVRPIGTGPYVVDDFVPNDAVQYSINPNYREPNKPYFATVNLKGGGDAASAARAVLQTGDWDFAWNLQVEPAILEDLMGSSEAGTVQFQAGTNVERININFSDPNTEVNGERSQKDTPHPFLTDPAVRQAMALAADRDTISTQFYGAGEPATANFLTGVPAWDSQNTSYTYDLEQAKQILDAAGWVMDGDTRKKDGVELKVTYSTTINPVRQKTQAVIKQGFEEIGIGVSLQQVDSGIFFDGSPGNEQNASHMYVD